MFIKVKLFARDEWIVFREKDLRKVVIDMNGNVTIYLDEWDEPQHLDSNEHGPGAPKDLLALLALGGSR